MSFDAVAWAIHQRCESSGQKLVLIALADACGGDDDDARMCWPSVERIGGIDNLSDRTVREHIDRLEALGLVTKLRRRRRADGTLGTWVYLIEWQIAQRRPTAGGAELPAVGPVPTGDVPPLDYRRPTAALYPVISESVNDPVTPTRSGDNFETFWTLYPRKVSKRDAAKTWARMKPAEHDAAIEAITAHALVWQVQGRSADKVPHAATWLNGRRWEDDLGGEQARAVTGLDAVIARQRRAAAAERNVIDITERGPIATGTNAGRRAGELPPTPHERLDRGDP